MRRLSRVLRVGGTACAVALTAVGCGFQGLNSLPLPGTVAGGHDDWTYRAQLANIATLEPNSPVMLGNVIVGSIRSMRVDNWMADVEISVDPDVVVSANVRATVGQTSLLGSMHLALDPPVGTAPTGRLTRGATIEVTDTSTYPSTEQTLSSLAVVVNGGGFGQIGDIIGEFNAALNGREPQVRDLFRRLDDLLGMFDSQRGDINASISELNRMAATMNEQSEVITRALERIPPALEVLADQRPRITDAMSRLGQFGTAAADLIEVSQQDLVDNLTNLEPTLRALSDIGPDLATALSFATTFPYSQSFIDRGVRGDYMNLFLTFDLTVPRLKRTLFLGTRWGQEGAPLVPAPGDPWYSHYTLDPLNLPVVAGDAVDVAPLPDLVDPVDDVPVVEGP